MIAIIPVFIEADHDLWSRPQGKELMLKSFNAAKNARGVEKAFVFTNDDSILNFAVSRGMHSHMIHVGTEKEKS